MIFYLPANVSEAFDWDFLQILQYSNDEKGIIEGIYFISMVSFLTLMLTTLI
jgi:hypothetical protein